MTSIPIITLACSTYQEPLSGNILRLECGRPPIPRYYEMGGDMIRSLGSRWGVSGPPQKLPLLGGGGAELGVDGASRDHNDDEW